MIQIGLKNKPTNDANIKYTKIQAIYKKYV